MQVKTKLSSGADELTPSLPQYFSWVNNGNEGSTEEQTKINLDYFRFLHDEYGMQLRIYAWDAGNLDGASGTYERFDGAKLTKQFPNGYGPVVDLAKTLGVSLGVWGGADGFGDTKEEENARFEQIVSLCRDYGFMLFKFDTVCGQLRANKRETFKRMIDTCRSYVPELIVLNHRNNLGEAEICATTYLWGGVETYIDVHIRNSNTGSHHRCCTLERGLVPDMGRLTEDHGVCISSCLDFFTDDLVLQAFNRSLILAPEIYGNPWLLRDDEQRRLANLYNLHRKYADILVSGFALPESYGAFAVSRGNGEIRLITLRNNSWQATEINLLLSEEIGLAETRKIKAKEFHPYTKYLGEFDFGARLTVTVEPFRVKLIGVFAADAFDTREFALTNCAYYIDREVDGKPIEVDIIATDGQPIALTGSKTGVLADAPQVFDHTLGDPILLGSMAKINVPQNAEQLYEATAFRADNDSLEYQSLKRSGETKIPQVQAARDAFFAQDTYKFRGCEGRNLFDGDPETYFDAVSRHYGTRMEGGCLRVDFGGILDVARIELEFFSIENPRAEVKRAILPLMGDTSTDLREWAHFALQSVTELKKTSARVVVAGVHTIAQENGARMRAVYAAETGRDKNGVRYFRLPLPPDRIYSLKAFSSTAEEAVPPMPSANILLAPYEAIAFRTAYAATAEIPADVADGDYLAAAVNGKHGREGAYCAAAVDGKVIGFADRAISYPVINWEHLVNSSDANYTYYLPLQAADAGKIYTVYTLAKSKDAELTPDVYLCRGDVARSGMPLTIDG